MKNALRFAFAIILTAVYIISGSFNSVEHIQPNSLTGAWHADNRGTSITWVFIDDYAVMTTYDLVNKRFIMTAGGSYTVKDDMLSVVFDFYSIDSLRVGKNEQFKIEIKSDQLTMNSSHNILNYKRLDNGSGSLAGVWYIAGRLENGQINERQLGPRRTLKVLSGTRFQWIAINPSVKGFYGTGGGKYTFANGKYTENIEFFPRDSTRVGASLTFDGKVENGAWMHSGLSSRGEPLNEVWKRLPKN